ncbi:Crp/Fnr family transcriptional regulator [Xanthobacter autotrophicus DSM 597]|uniref:Crp/Fnr family transcriptional regulator n=1 Tax=Xanthobacteraceae TaxID=335928 RepID=UPI003729E66D
MDRADAERILASAGWLSRQPVSFQNALFRQGYLVNFAKGEYLYRIGDAAGGIYGLLEGGFAAEVMVGRSLSRVAHVLRRYNWIGTGPALSGQTRVFTFRAIEPGSALHLPIAGVNKLRTEDPSAIQRIGALAEENMKLAIHVVSDLLIRSTDRRISAALLRISGASVADPSPPPHEVMMTQSELGEIANASRDVVSRLLKRMQTQGWVELGYNRIRIVDADALQSFTYDGVD